jgi:hypothetical protein
MQRRKIVTRSRLQAAGAMAAFAFIVGITAPSGGVAGPATTSGSSTVTAAADSGAVPSATLGADAALAEGADALASAVAPVAPSAPTEAELHPLPVTADQQRFTPTEEQLRNAKAIVDTGKAMGLPPRAWTIAVATSLQESNLQNLGHLGARNDHDSQGLFQQRPSSGWGTPEQITDPTYAATRFYQRLVEVPGWDTLPLTRAAQTVQVSAYPNHYAKHEAEAGDIVEALYGAGPYADIAASVR